MIVLLAEGGRPKRSGAGKRAAAFDDASPPAAIKRPAKKAKKVFAYAG
jgi:hypothetical protein